MDYLSREPLPYKRILFSVSFGIFSERYFIAPPGGGILHMYESSLLFQSITITIEAELTISLGDKVWRGQFSMSTIESYFERSHMKKESQVHGQANRYKLGQNSDASNV